jgi:hypothetical protein
LEKIATLQTDGGLGGDLLKWELEILFFVFAVRRWQKNALPLQASGGVSTKGPSCRRTDTASVTEIGLCLGLSAVPACRAGSRLKRHELDLAQAGLARPIDQVYIHLRPPSTNGGDMH